MLRRFALHAVGMLGVLRAQEVAEPTAAQRARIDRGESVVVTQSLPGSSWPAVTVFRFVDASPEEVAAVFVDYALHESFIPRVKRSRVSRVIDATAIEVDYTVELPFLSDEEYTVRNQLIRDGTSGFRVKWILVRAVSTKATVGHARFQPYENARTGRKGTVLEYRNFVTPGSRMAGLAYIRNRAVQQVEETARAIAEKAEAERKQERTMAERVARFRSSLARGAVPPTGLPRRPRSQRSSA